jgi:hypothetical protein
MCTTALLGTTLNVKKVWTTGADREMDGPDMDCSVLCCVFSAMMSGEIFFGEATVENRVFLHGEVHC